MKDRMLSDNKWNNQSDPMSLNNSTPQGSIITQTLFKIMINYLFDHVNSPTQNSIFADDGAIRVKHNIYTNPKENSSVDEWCNKRRFTLSSENAV